MKKEEAQKHLLRCVAEDSHAQDVVYNLHGARMRAQGDLAALQREVDCLEVAVSTAEEHQTETGRRVAEARLVEEYAHDG